MVQSADQTDPVNCAPLSLVIKAGTPKHATQQPIKAFTRVVVVMSAMGNASGHLVVLSTAVNKYLKPSLTGKGPTMSMLTDENGTSGIGTRRIGAEVCRVIFDD